MTETFDRRRHPVRPELAASTYRGRVDAERYVDGDERQVIAERLAFRREPRLDRPVDTEGLFGERVTVYETNAEGWAWGQLATDGYVGWFSSDSVGPSCVPTHRVSALRTFRYPEPDLKYPPLGALSIASMVTVTGAAETRGLAYARLSDGSFVVEKHLVGTDHVIEDWVETAERFLETPYLWGGRSSLGLDCSALVQLSAGSGGLALPRDSDMQEAEAGTPVTMGDPSRLLRGDLMFWKGHVAIVSGPNRLLHANGHTMTVAHEPMDQAIARIAANEWGAVTSVRRLR